MINNSGLMILCGMVILVFYYAIEYIKQAYEPWLKEKNLHIDQIFIFFSLGTLLFFGYLYMQDDATRQQTVLTNWYNTTATVITPLIIFFVLAFLFEAIRMLPAFKEDKGGQHFDKKRPG